MVVRASCSLGLASKMLALLIIINAYYDKGYRLKGFSTASSGNIAITEYFAAVCKE